MARNRKSQSAAIRFGPALKAALLCLLIGGSGLGYVWQKEQISKLGQEKKRRESMLNALEDQNDQLRRLLASMRTLEFLELQIKKNGLGLAKPQDSQILRLPEPVVESPRAQVAAQYAARVDRGSDK
ncbi:MAG TPA: hypothetical protein VL793_02310 [Patescibacteria group bacterium]|nr:hypothetical protein [Patescibacteria group bacterium]